jgi:serine/threonine-protein kinase
MKIACPHCDAQIDVIQEDLQLSCPSCGSRLHLLDETLVQTKEAPKVVAHFELLEQVGRGHFGDVWKAHDVVLDRMVAVKIPRTGGLDQRTVQLFVREARAAANLRHENIVTVHQVFLDDQAVYIVSDLINGVTLADQMRHKHRTPREAAELCATIAEALHYAHNNGVEAHRDIKPGNVMVDTAGKPYVMDFGLAKLDSADFTMTVAGQLLGTPAYMSPEQAQGKETDRHTDIYSLGIILYELLTHIRPFTGDTKLLIHQIVSEEPRAPRRVNKSIPRPLETICLKAMAKEPERRYATAAEFAADLRRFLDGKPILAKPVSPLEKAWRWIIRNPVVAGLSAAAAVLLIALAVVSVQNTNKERALYRNVAITTNPPGASLAFIPLDEMGRPIETGIVRPAGTTPLEAELPPGHFLVEAVLPSGDFHQVHRFVSSEQTEGRGGHNHNTWVSRPDGTIDLPAITILASADVTRNMTLFTGGVFQMGHNDIPAAPAHSRRVDDFYLDQTEVTNAEYGSINADPQTPVTGIAFDQVLHFAEQIGKRPMTEAEYEYAATRGGTQKYPWGNDAARIVPEIFSIQPVRQPDFDQTSTNPPVYGLFSNATEWTASLQLPYTSTSPIGNKPSFVDALKSSREQRGGPITIEETTTVTEGILQGPRRRYAELKGARQPFVGFRCARDAKPRYVSPP